MSPSPATSPPASVGAATPSPGAPASAAPASATPATDAVEIRISLRDGKVRPSPGRVSVRQGGTVRLVVDSDVADELHVHGFDIETPIGPGTPGTLEFVADESGLFEVETHEGGKLLTSLLIR